MIKNAVLRQHYFGIIFIYFCVIVIKVKSNTYIMDWIDQHEKMLNTINFEKEPVSLIKCYFMFVDNNNEIVKVTKEETELIVGDDLSLLSKDDVLNMVQRQKATFNNSKFLYNSLIYYSIDLNDNTIEEFLEDVDEDGRVNGDVSYNFLKQMPLMEDVHIAPCIYFFHSLCSLYFIFQEMPKPILKLSGFGSGGGQKKRVTIKTNKPSNHSTRKNIS